MKKIFMNNFHFVFIIFGYIVSNTVISNIVSKTPMAFLLDALYLLGISLLVSFVFTRKISYFFNLLISTIMIVVAFIWVEYHFFFGDVPSFKMIFALDKLFEKSTGYGISVRLMFGFVFSIVYLTFGITFYNMMVKNFSMLETTQKLRVVKFVSSVITIILPIAMTSNIVSIGMEMSIYDDEYFETNNYLYNSVTSNNVFVEKFGSYNNFFRSFMSSGETYSDDLIEQYINNRSDWVSNENTNIYKDYNLLNITVETLDTRLINPIIAPNLYFLLNNSITFDNYYANTWIAGGTCNSEWMMLTSMYPAVTADDWTNSLCWSKSIQDLKIKNSLPRVLQRNGYKTHYVHSGEAHTYNRHNIMKNVLGFENMYFANSWIYDSGMMDYISNIDTKDKFYIQILTVAMHNGWDDGMKQNLEFVLNNLPEVKLKVLQEYYAKMIETDRFIGEVLKKLKDDNVYNNTLITITSDHWLYYAADSMDKYLELIGDNAILFQDLSVKIGNKFLNQGNSEDKDLRLERAKLIREYEWQKKIINSNYYKKYV